MSTQPPLFGARRRRGIARSQLDRTLTALRKAGTLAGDEHAAARSMLRDAAEAVDVARESMRAGDGSPYTLSMCLRVYRELLDMARHDQEGSADAFDELLRAFGDAGTEVRDSP
jgi:hypothetical protein